MVCLRNISVDTLHKGDTEDNNNIPSSCLLPTRTLSGLAVHCYNNTDMSKAPPQPPLSLLYILIKVAE